MPGLFDNSSNGQGGGILEGIGNYFNNIAANMDPAYQESLFRRQGAKTIDQALGPGMGALMMGNPAAAQQLYAQRNLQITHDSLVGSRGPDGKPISDQQAWILALHPEIITEQGKPINVPPGGSVYTPLFSGGGAGGAPSSAQQQPPSSQPGPSDASVGGGVPGAQFTNNQGQISDPALQMLVERRLRGDTEVNNEIGSGMSGLNPINRANFQRLLEQTMRQRNLTGSDLARIDARFPAYKDAVKKNADIGSSMQLAQSEASTLLPLVKQAGLATNPSDFPIFNAAKQEYMAQTGDPRTATLASYMNALVNTYARGITTRSQGATDKDKEHIRDIVNPYWSKGQWEAGAQAITNEFGAAHDALRKNGNRIDVQFGFGKDATPADVAAAQQAISRGANKNDVIRRFEEEGFNAPKF